ncbi:replication factor C large subunit [Candidatus Pacearchaeota archaeon]|nr:replication factor C large subunit [Candidatus Pacearchaeota archaeon]
MTLPLIEKYRAGSLKDIKGQDTVISDIRTFLKTFPKKRALILSGPVGTGKTSMALAFAKDDECELFELNASDLRNRSKLEAVLAPAIKQKSLFNKKKLILMDEADGITTSDRGGLPELIALIEKTSFPIIITANDIWKRKFSLLRKKCKIIAVKELKDDVIFNILKEVCLKENHQKDDKTLQLIVKNSKGDMRAALNDLQTLLELGNDAFIEEFYEREKEESIFDALKTVFQDPTDPKITRIYDSTKMDLNEIALWVEENIPSEYSGSALAKAYISLSTADIFRGRIYRQQYWRFMVYQNFFLSAGISCATKLKYKKFRQYKRPSRILKIWLANQKNAKKKSIVAKYAKACHMSKKKAMKNSFLLPLIINKETEDKLNLEERERDYLLDKRGAIIIASQLNKFRI